ncbi:putative membrane protein [Candidatus Kuenenia stuttgartiensis]|jgi:hypothetical protein|uniref:Putative membrane protein n=1 Tax=Kuenenia stuttgartiensis TaxID=174633 RepID=Q1Q4A2_KUEST|nr:MULTISPECIES: hypothetical protein [Kuenenia]MBE7547293.1 hypothetical protein [Planctomycetia bacterium]MBZ0192365.1 hypothetical protein [Candidatus Kuenenia stuttgartiensis]MCF6151614.1 hypothetical protein [Candidatus Kuenenia stuttgartiensis]MCL4728586.1 hypothetical protein [Candidatus Kuenenia stuttgartiensis]MCZ7622053.1 hypothetical protein [Candidatus Kuenenia sp.]
MNLLKRTIPLIIAFVMGVLMAIQYYVPHKLSQNLLEVVTRWDRIIAGFAVFIGAYSLFHLHWARIRRKVEGWGYSVFVFFGAAITITFGLLNGGKFFWHNKQDGTMLDWIYYYVQVPAGATIFSILAFFIASAAYRTFRARTRESAVLLIAAIVVMLGRVPIGNYISHYIPAVADWIMAVPNLAAKRGILLGVSFGAIATSIKIIFGIERSYLGGGD